MLQALPVLTNPMHVQSIVRNSDCPSWVSEAEVMMHWVVNNTLHSGYWCFKVQHSASELTLNAPITQDYSHGLTCAIN